MKRLIYVLAVLVFAGAAYMWRGPLRDPSHLPGNTCSGRDFCISVYMAPWCPHCKSAVPQVQKLLSASQSAQKPGVKVVIGMGEPEQNEAMGKSIARDVALDNDTSLAEKLKIQGVPSYLVLDKEGTVILDGPEAHEWINERFGG